MIRIFAKLTTSDPKFGAYFDRNAKKKSGKIFEKSRIRTLHLW